MEIELFDYSQRKEKNVDNFTFFKVVFKSNNQSATE